MMIFHGGIGNIQQQQHFWKSAELQEDYILVFVQGRQFLSSGTRRFGNEGIVDIKKIYTKIKNDYLIDTTKVILGGPSAGGMLSIDLAINNHIPVQGLILAFPVKPGAFGADEIYEAGIRGLRVSMICGENDWALESQKEMSVIFDKLNVENRIVIYPENGHEYPDDFEKQISKSIEYTFNN
jgi:predicted esterase